MKKLVTALCAIGSALLVQGCVSVPGTGVTSASDIAVDAVALNDAFGRAMNGQILLNALRARDRWPRQYVKFTGITNQPRLAYSLGLTLNPLPLNGASDSLRDSSAPLSREQSSAYNYGIEPLSATDVNNIILPLRGSVFTQYWNGTGWPRDVLLLVMARGLERSPIAAISDAQLRQMMRGESELSWGAVRRSHFTQDDADDALACTDDAAFSERSEWPSAAAEAEGRCAFFRIVHRMAAWTHRSDGAGVRVRSVDDGIACFDVHELRAQASNAPLVAALNAAAQSSGGAMRMQLTPSESRRNEASLTLRRCESGAPVLLEVLDGRGAVIATYRVALRSIDDMIYNMGTLLRPAIDDRGREHERMLSRGPCPEGSGREYCPSVPLFSARASSTIDPRSYAARADHQGRRYLAGPALLNEGEPGADRTATVITLLSQLFTLNVAASTTPPPARLNTN